VRGCFWAVRERGTRRKRRAAVLLMARRIADD